jgi:hypothetical protein
LTVKAWKVGVTKEKIGAAEPDREKLTETPLPEAGIPETPQLM